MSKYQSVSEIENLISKAPYWHHRIELAPGIFTPGLQDTQALLLQISFPEDLSGREFLISVRVMDFFPLKQSGAEPKKLLHLIMFLHI